MSTQSVKRVGAGLKPAPTATTATRHGLPEIMLAFKTFAAPRPVNELPRTLGEPLWQRSYYEHIIRDEVGLNRIRQYVIDNPRNWADDLENPISTDRMGLDDDPHAYPALRRPLAGRRGKALLVPVDIRSTTWTEGLLPVSPQRGIVPRKSANATMFKAESYVGYKLCWPRDPVINSLWAWASRRITASSVPHMASIARRQRLRRLIHSAESDRQFCRSTC